jgi:hypothetical protein
MAIRFWSGLKLKKLLPLHFIILVITLIVNRYILRYAICPFFDNYLNDLLSIPVMLFSTAVLLGLIYGQIPFNLSNKMIFLAVFATSLVFEFMLPSFSTKYTYDLLDILMYTIGAFYYKLFFQ